MNIVNLLKEASEKWPEKTAITDNFGRMTYRELWKQVNELGKDLSRLSLERGLALGIVTKNDRYFLISLMAGVACDALVMPIYHQQKQNEIEATVREGQLHFVLADQPLSIEGVHLENTIEQTDHQWKVYRTKRPVSEKTAAFIADAALMRFTSGTTGTAKGVVMSHNTIVERIEAANRVLKLSENDKVVWVLPMAFHFVVSLILYIRYGVEIIVNDSFLADSIAESIQNQGATLLYASPMHIKLLASYSQTPELPTLKTVISTTTAISAELCHAFQKKYNLPVVQAFGIIEVGLPIINMQKSEEFPEAVGYALPDYEVGILDEDHELLDNGKVGLLGIRGPGMFDGYLFPPTPKKEVLKKGWFLTGDYAVRKENGLIIIKGRKKNVINVSGNKVFPYEVEEALNSHPEVVHSRAYSKIHPLLGEVVAADVVLKNKELDTELLINHCRKTLSPFKVPQSVKVVDKLEMTASGKIKV